MRLERQVADDLAGIEQIDTQPAAEQRDHLLRREFLGRHHRERGQRGLEVEAPGRRGPHSGGWRHQDVDGEHPPLSLRIEDKGPLVVPLAEVARRRVVVVVGDDLLQRVDDLRTCSWIRRHDHEIEIRRETWRRQHEQVQAESPADHEVVRESHM